MTKLWRRQQVEYERTEAFIAESDWLLAFDYSLGVSKWEKTDTSGPTIVEVESKHPPGDYLDAKGMFVVSERMKQLLQEFDVHAEYLPIRINYGGAEYKSQTFYCCNILDAVDCLDFERGDYTFHQDPRFSDHIDHIKKLVIDETKASPYHLFRIAKGGEYIVCVSDRLAAKIVESGLTGAMFVETEKWSIY